MYSPVIMMDQPMEVDQVALKMISFSKLGTSLEEIIQEKSKITTFALNFMQSPQNFNEKDTKLGLLHLRRFNRHLSNIIVEQKRKLAALKSVVDELNCKYLCQKYEKQHLIDEIRACLNSKHIYPTAVESLNPSLGHDEMIQILQSELAMRKDLQTKLISVLQKKQETEIELEAKKQKLESLRGCLQNLLKNSKSLVDACGYDLDALHKRKMNTDDLDSSLMKNHSDSSWNDAEIIQQIHEKLVALVASKPDYKLRFFEAVVDEPEEDDSTAETRSLRSVKSAYIQIIMNLNDNPEEEEKIIDLFLTLQSGILFLLVRQESFPEAANWIKSIQIFEMIEPAMPIDDLTNSAALWMTPLRLQPDAVNSAQDSAVFDEIFMSIRAAILLRLHLQNFILTHSGLLDFDKNNPAELEAPQMADLKARISLDSIVWRGAPESNELVDNLNATGAKYRSVIDCLDAQIDLIRNINHQ